MLNQTNLNASADALTLIRTLAAGKTATVTLACGNPHRFEPRDLLRNQEAVLLFAAIEQVLARYVGNNAKEIANVELCAELGLSPVRVPSLSLLLDRSRGKLPSSLIQGLYSLKSLRNAVLHGSAPLFVKGNVKRIRKSYADLLEHTNMSPDAALGDAIALSRASLQNPSSIQNPASYAFLVDLIEMVDVERSLRNHLIAQGMKVQALQAVECAHELLKHLKTNYLPKGLVGNLRRIFILRNHTAHGLLFGLTPAHKALVGKTSADMHGAISGTNLAKSGGKMTLGDGFANGALALGLAAVSLG